MPTTWRASSQSRSSRPRRLAKLEPYFDKHLATQGTAPYQLLADVAGRSGPGRPTDRAAGKAARATIQATYRWRIFWRSAIARPDQLDKAEPIYADTDRAQPDAAADRSLSGPDRRLSPAERIADKLLAIVGESLARVGTLAPLGDSGKALARRHRDVQGHPGRGAARLPTSDPVKLTYGARLAAASWPIELKDFAAANQFFDMAIAAEPKKAGEVAGHLGPRAVHGQPICRRGRRSSSAGWTTRCCREKQSDVVLLPGRRAGDERPHRRGHRSGPQGGRAAKGLAPLCQAARPGSSITPSATTPRDKSYQELIEKFDKKHDSPEVREVLRDARLVMSNICGARKQDARSRRMARASARRISRGRRRHERPGLRVGRRRQASGAGAADDSNGRGP